MNKEANIYLAEVLRGVLAEHADDELREALEAVVMEAEGEVEIAQLVGA